MYLLRHGQSEFNLHFSASRRDPGIEDPSLTEAGVKQARGAARQLKEAGIRKIIASPYRRALQTAHEAAAILQVPVTIELLIRERFAFVCDIGTPRSVLERDWPGCRFDGMEENWWNQRLESEAEVVARAARFRESISQWDHAHDGTLLVSHWGFLLALTGRSLANGESLRWDPADPVPTELDWL